MAFNSMKVIHGGLADRLRYIMNPAKTENGLLCAGINTTPATAHDDMMATKHRYGKADKRQGYHIIQSFAPGEIEPDTALQFGMEFIEKYLGNRYEGVAAVHTDKAHVHVHMIFNSVSFIDGRKYHAARGEYLECIRKMCDEQCKAWGLSVIDGDFTVRKTTKDEARSKSQGKLSCRDMIRRDIDRAITESFAWQNFIPALRKQGYQIKETRTNVSLKAPGMQRFIRLKSLGEGYSEYDIRMRLSNNLHNIERVIIPDEVPIPKDEAFDRFIGTQAYYYNVTRQMRKLIDQRHMRYAPALRAEIRKLDQWDEDLMFQERHHITTMDELQKFREENLALIAEITRRREPIYRERRKSTVRENAQRMAELDAELQKYKTVLAGLRREVRIADRIENRLNTKVQTMLAAEEAQIKIKRQMQEEKHHSRNNRNRGRP